MCEGERFGIILLLQFWVIDFSEYINCIKTTQDCIFWDDYYLDVSPAFPLFLSLSIDWFGFLEELHARTKRAQAEQENLVD